MTGERRAEIKERIRKVVGYLFASPLYAIGWLLGRGFWLADLISAAIAEGFDQGSKFND